MSSIKDFFINLKYNTEGKVALASIIINMILIIVLGSIMATGDVPGYTPRAELEANATECTLEHIDPDATTTTTTTTTIEDDTTSSTTNKATTTKKTTTKNNGGATTTKNGTTTTTKKTTTTTTKKTTTTTKSLDNDGEWVEGWY